MFESTPPKRAGVTTGSKWFALSFAACILIASCASQPDSSATTSDHPRSSLGTSDPGNWSSFEQSPGFWDAAGFNGGDEVERFDTLDQMTTSASAVIVGEFIGIEPGRMISDPDVPEDVVSYPAARIRVVDILSGELAALSERGNEIVVESIGSRLLDFKDDYPSGEFIAFLRYKGEMYDAADRNLPPVAEGDLKAYRWVSSDGLYVEKDGLAFNPLVEREMPDGDAGNTKIEVPNAHASGDYGTVAGESGEMIEEIEEGSMDALVADIISG